MQSLIIVPPIKWASSAASVANMARMLTPDPKEAVQFQGGSIQLDAGFPVSADSIFIGYHTALADQQFAAYATDANYNPIGVLALTQGIQPLGLGPPWHFFNRSPGVLTSRYWRVDFNNGSQPVAASYLIGVLAIGLAFQTTFGTEYGGGRLIEDTGSAERLFGGGFGIDDGVACGGYQWTFGDLSADETRRLYQLVKDRRTTRSVLVVEDPDQTDGLNERIHWGLFRKLDAYERLDPINTKWALQIGDWG